ncbi:amidohydrolase family protein [Aerococcaceae bacterium WGS1372]
MQKIFDSHFHIIDPNFPLIENNGFVPDYYSVDEYKEELNQLGLKAIGGAVVSGSFQGYEQAYFEEALKQLGDQFVGITQLHFDVTDEELQRLHHIGIRGIRFNLYRGLSSSLEEIEELSSRCFNLLGWKTEFYVDIAKVTDELKSLILSLPATSIDHIGMTKVPAENLIGYLHHGVPIRLTGFGRVEYSRDDIKQLIRELYNANPKGLIFGTDLPSTRAAYRFSGLDIELIQEVLNEEECENVFWKNGLEWYLGD